MAKLFLYHKGVNEYLCINITNQTSTGWHSDLAKVEELADTTTRKLSLYFSTFANISLDETIHKVESGHTWKIYRIENDSPTAYEYW